MTEPSPPLLTVNSMVAGYGKRRVVNGVSLRVAPGEIVALIGHNGAGKSTILKAIFGLIPFVQGNVAIDYENFDAPTPRTMIENGVVYAPQGNRVFGNLTIRENLELGGITLSDRTALEEAIERSLTLFPKLRNRLQQRAGTLSGGEKQILALARALVLSPRLLLLDEPSLGLAPRLISEAFQHIRYISQRSQVAVLIVEQKIHEVLKIAERVYVLRNGLIVHTGPSEQLHDSTLREVFL